MTLTEFLLARIAEDETPARALLDAHPTLDRVDHGPRQQDQFARLEISPARVVARCKADRQLLELHADNGSIPGKYELRCYACESDYPCDTLKIMALPYAGHPDYHPGWRS